MSKLKHAFYTDPKDQSPWFYQDKLLAMLTPIQVVNVFLNRENNTIEIGLSQKVKHFNKLDISLVDQDGNPFPFTTESKTGRSLSSAWLLKLKV